MGRNRKAAGQILLELAAFFQCFFPQLQNCLFFCNVRETFNIRSTALCLIWRFNLYASLLSWKVWWFEIALVWSMCIVQQQPMALLCHTSALPWQEWFKFPNRFQGVWCLSGMRWWDLLAGSSTSSRALPAQSVLELGVHVRVAQPPDKYFGAWLFRNGRIGQDWPVSLQTRNWACLMFPRGALRPVLLISWTLSVNQSGSGQ